MLWEKNSEAVMHMQDRNVRIAGQNYTAQEDVQQMHIMQQEAFEESMNQDANYLENVSNVQSWWRLQKLKADMNTPIVDFVKNYTVGFLL